MGTLLNVCTILFGSTIGVVLGHRLSEQARSVVTDGLGLVVLLVAGVSCTSVLDPDLERAVGSGAVLVILAAVVLGGLAGSLLRIEERLEALGRLLRTRAGRGSAGGPAEDSAESVRPAAVAPGRAHDRFLEGFVTASLVFCVGPLTVLGSLDDGLGLGIDKLALKSTLDGFASVALAAGLGWGVAASALTAAVVQGSLTLLAWAGGDLLSSAQVSALTATGGVLLVGVALRLLRIRAVAVANLLPALLVAPVLVYAVDFAR